jgi:ABC-type transport system involved in multi-copper enzyme maturation permease subunit
MFNALLESRLLTAGVVLGLLQCLAALPWLWAVDPAGFRKASRNPSSLGTAVLFAVALGVFITLFVGNFGESDSLRLYGRVFASILHIQLLIALFLAMPQVLILIAPKAGAVALAAYREAWRQPMFWLITAGASMAMIVSVFVPYYTFGDDYKMMKMIGFDIVMLSAAFFGILAAALSISEEIEGRTAITVISKPINRRSFLIGKYLGILMACLSMGLMLAWVLNWALLISTGQEKITEVRDVMNIQAQEQIVPSVAGLFSHSTAAVFAEGIGAWIADTFEHSLGVGLGFGQVMILVAIATALATRLAFVVNVLVTLIIYFLGNLAPVIVKATSEKTNQDTSSAIIRFFGQMFDTLLPALEFFQMNTAIVRETPLDIGQFVTYVATVLGYALIYTTISLLVGLLMFENRDLA